MQLYKQEAKSRGSAASVPFPSRNVVRSINLDIGVSQLRENKKLWRFYGSWGGWGQRSKERRRGSEWESSSYWIRVMKNFFMVSSSFLSLPLQLLQKKTSDWPWIETWECKYSKELDGSGWARSPWVQLPCRDCDALAAHSQEGILSVDFFWWNIFSSSWKVNVLTVQMPKNVLKFSICP